jgi:hypothetical protein
MRALHTTRWIRKLVCCGTSSHAKQLLQAFSNKISKMKVKILLMRDGSIDSVHRDLFKLDHAQDDVERT